MTTDPQRGPLVPPGYRIGPWEVTALIAAGTWGDVHAARLAEPAPSGEPPPEAAVKILRCGIGTSRLQRWMSEREATFAESLRSPRLIRTFETRVIHDDHDPALDGAAVLVMERAADNLRSMLLRATPGTPVANAGRLLTEICEGMAQMHEVGWVHGDLKPGNVLLMADGSVRLADFGLASHLDDTHAYAPTVGSADYLPPEWMTERVTELGVVIRPTRDIWAFGVLAHQILTGGLFPFDGGDSRARVAAVKEYTHGRTQLRLADGIPEGWRLLIIDCLSPNHETRARHIAGTVLERVRQLADGSDAVTTSRRTSPRLRRMMVVGLPVVLLAAALGAWWLAPDRDGGPHAPAGATVTVFNVEVPCQNQRVRVCSLGLALDPNRAYDASNVSTHRVWHGDQLTSNCILYGGTRVADENGVQSTTWYRVVVADEPSGHAWLPAVRTRDAPTLPVCGPADLRTS
jgi:serine/threonine-protein kinase